MKVEIMLEIVNIPVIMECDVINVDDNYVLSLIKNHQTIAQFSRWICWKIIEDITC